LLELQFVAFSHSVQFRGVCLRVRFESKGSSAAENTELAEKGSVKG